MCNPGRSLLSSLAENSVSMVTETSLVAELSIQGYIWCSSSLEICLLYIFLNEVEIMLIYGFYKNIIAQQLQMSL